MMKLITICLIILISVWVNVFAGEQRQIELNDGSTISGEILAFKEGVYTIKSNSLGTIEIEDANIRSIRSLDAATITTPSISTPTNLPINPELKQLQNIMLNDQNIMDIILSLQEDPQFKAILQDPEVVSAVTSGNFNTLLANPNFMKLLEHQQVQKIAKELEKKQATPAE